MKLYKLAALGLAALSGCALNVRDGTKYEKFTVRPEFSIGGDIAYVRTKVPEKLRTTPVHKDDEYFLSGSTTTDNPAGFEARAKAGARVSAGSWLRVIAGADARVGMNYLAAIEGDMRHSAFVHDVRPHDSDGRSSDASPVYTEVFQVGSIIPVVGLEANLDPFTVRAEVGAPFSVYRLQSGHKRFGEREVVQSERWAGFGRRGALRLMYEPNRQASFGFEAGVESHEPDFGAGGSKVESGDFMLMAEYKF